MFCLCHPMPRGCGRPVSLGIGLSVDCFFTRTDLKWLNAPHSFPLWPFDQYIFTFTELQEDAWGKQLTNQWLTRYCAYELSHSMSVYHITLGYDRSLLTIFWLKHSTRADYTFNHYSGMTLQLYNKSCMWGKAWQFFVVVDVSLIGTNQFHIWHLFSSMCHST